MGHRRHLAHDLASGALEACLEAFVIEERSIYLAHRGTTPVAPRIRTFVDFCSAHVDEDAVFAPGRMGQRDSVP